MKKKTFIGIVIASCVIVLSACSFSEEKSGKETNLVDKTQAATKVETKETDNREEKDSNHISKDLSETFKIDADVVAPESAKIDTLMAKYTRIDEKKTVQLLFKDGVPNKEVTEDNSVLYTDKETIMNSMTNAMTFEKEEYKVLQYVTDGFSMENEVISALPKFGNVFKKENLDFMSREDALKTVREFCEELSIDTAEQAEIYALDSENLQKCQEERKKEEIEIMKNSGVDPSEEVGFGYSLKDKFSKDDECYLIVLSIMEDKLPLTQKSYEIMEADRSMEGGKVVVYLSDKGIISAEIDGLYQITGTDTETSKTIIPVEDAIQRLYEIENETLSTDRVEVAKISLEYVPVPYNDNYDEVKLVPAWCFLNKYNYDDGEKNNDFSIERVVSINAITGEEIK
ncbi:MAG: hypothetical protein K6G65_10880 [Lachnospiraceae bacterium]|nr:hypothetical protein [Lachnospiraceae bacterium]